MTPEQAMQAISLIADELETDLSEPLEEWLGDAAAITQAAMMEGRSPSGRTHAPLRRPRPPGHNQGTTPLLDTYQLFKSLADGGTGNVSIARNRSATYGTVDRVAGFHQFGTVNMPARKFLEPTDEILDLAVSRVGNFLLNRISRIPQ